MKKINFITIGLLMLFVSCSNDLLVENDSLQLTAKSSTYMDVEAIYFDNGVHIEHGCAYNMLVFDDFAHYMTVLEYLEDAVEAHEDDFVEQNIYLDEDELNDYEHELEDMNQFHYLQPLIDFEDILKFCSLRNKIEIAEIAWLATQTDSTAMDFTNDPDNFYNFAGIGDEERTLLNEQAEVIVGEYLYKFYDGGFIYIPVNDPDITDILIGLNSGELEPDGSFSEQYPQAVVVPDPPQNSGGAGCDTHHNKTKYTVVVNNQIKMKAKVKTGPFNHTAISITRGYKWKNGQWKNRRLNIAAGFRGHIGSPYYAPCAVMDNFEPNTSTKKRRKRKYANRVPRAAAPNSYSFKTTGTQERLYSWHRVNGNDHQELIPY